MSELTADNVLGHAYVLRHLLPETNTLGHQQHTQQLYYLGLCNKDAIIC